MKKVFLFILLLSNFQISFSQNFIKEIASSMGPGTSVGIYCNVAISSNNKIHICHYDYLNKDLLYTTNTTGSWQTVIVDSTGQVGEFCSIAVDGNNYAHVSYFGFIRNDSIGGGSVPYGNLKYASNTSGQWVTATIDTASGLLTRICVDKQNNVHIVHTELGVSDPVNHLLNIKYATNKSGAWQSTAVAPGVVKGADGSIAVDKNMNVHIAIRNEEGVGISPEGGMGGLRYVTDLTGSWTWTDVDTNFNAGNDVDIAVDTLNNPHISYLDKIRGLKYATNLSGNWNFEILDSTHNVGWNTSVAVDNNNKIHISYSDPSPLIDTSGHGYLKYAFNTSGNWNVLIIDSADAGMYTCIALDTLNMPHMVYTALNFLDGSGVLKHAYQSGTAGLTGSENGHNDIIIFPNPASVVLNIQVDHLKSKAEMRICDVNGRVQKSGIVFPENSTIDISELSPGIYFLYIVDEKILRPTLSFIKM